MTSKAAAVLAVSLLTLSAGTALAAEDRSTPRGAHRAFQTAINEGNVQALKDTSLFDDAWEKVLEAKAESGKQNLALRAAATARWGAAATDATFPLVKVDDVPGTSYHVQGDRAELRYGTTVVERYVQRDGLWKVDLVTPLSPSFPDDPARMLQFTRLWGKASRAVAAEIPSGKFATIEEAKARRLWLSSGEKDAPATAPATRPTSGPTTRPLW